MQFYSLFARWSTSAPNTLSPIRKRLRQVQAASLGLLLVSSAQAGLQTYTDSTSFLPLIPAAHLFDTTWAGASGKASYTISGPSPANTFNMTFTAPGPNTPTLWVSKGFIGPIDALNSLAIDLSGSPQMFGADVFGTDTNNTAISGDISVVATSNLGATATLIRNKDNRFAGFRATSPGEFISEVTISNQVTTPPYLFNALDNAYVGMQSPSIAPATVTSPLSSGTLTCTVVPVGNVSTCTATPAAGYRTQVISGCGGTATGAGVNGYTTGALTEACTVTASFEQLPYAITATPTLADAITAGGSVSCTPNPVAHGGTATCTAMPNTGYMLSNWGGTCTNTPASSLNCSVPDVSADQAVSAQFAEAHRGFSGTTIPSTGTPEGTASASFTGGGPTCRFDLANTALVAAPATLPADQTMPHGMLQFKLLGCDATPVNVSITWPDSVKGLSKWGKASADATEPSHFTPTNLAVAGNTTSFTVQDGELGDDDWAKNGEIVDPVGATVAVATPAPSAPTPVPSLGQWALLLLTVLMGGLVLRGGLRREMR
jgi:hypothetical protein